jgi:hypothetical protein
MDALDQLNYDSEPTGLWSLESIDDHAKRLKRDLNLLVLGAMEHTLSGIMSSDVKAEEEAEMREDQVRFCCNYALVALVDRLYLGLEALAVNMHSRLITRPMDLDPARACNASLKLLHIEPKINFKLDLPDASVKEAKNRLRGARDARNLIVHKEGRLVSEEKGLEPISVEGQEPAVGANKPPRRTAMDGILKTS